MTSFATRHEIKTASFSRSAVDDGEVIRSPSILGSKGHPLSRCVQPSSSENFAAAPCKRVLPPGKAFRTATSRDAAGTIQRTRFW